MKNTKYEKCENGTWKIWNIWKLHSGIHLYETLEIKNLKGAVVLPGGLKTPNKWKTNGN